MDANDDDGAKLEEGVGGFIRSLSKSVPRLIRTLRSKRVPPKSVASTADRFSTLMEVHSHFEGAKSEPTGEKWRWRAVTFLKALPPFLKSSILGTLVFEAYAFGTAEVHASREVDELRSALCSTVVGSLCGTLNGTLFIAWDLVEVRLQRCFSLDASFQSYKYSAGGIILSHAIVHGTLFGTYELIKRTIAPRTRSFTIDHVTAIFGAGMISACLSELVNHYGAVIERYGLRRGYRRLKYTPLPKLRVILPSSIPPALGFLAYEYSKPHK